MQGHQHGGKGSSCKSGGSSMLNPLAGHPGAGGDTLVMATTRLDQGTQRKHGGRMWPESGGDAVKPQL